MPASHWAVMKSEGRERTPSDTQTSAHKYRLTSCTGKDSLRAIPKIFVQNQTAEPKAGNQEILHRCKQAPVNKVTSSVDTRCQRTHGEKNGTCEEVLTTSWRFFFFNTLIANIPAYFGFMWRKFSLGPDAYIQSPGIAFTNACETKLQIKGQPIKTGYRHR